MCSPGGCRLFFLKPKAPEKFHSGTNRETRKGTFGGSAMSYADMRIPHGPLLAAFDYGAPVCVCFAFSADRYLLFAIT